MCIKIDQLRPQSEINPFSLHDAVKGEDVDNGNKSKQVILLYSTMLR